MIERSNQITPTNLIKKIYIHTPQAQAFVGKGKRIGSIDFVRVK
jgi:hypothetical protein